MTKTRTLFIAGTVIPAFVLTQMTAGAAQGVPSRFQVAQAPGEPNREHGPAAPARPPVAAPPARPAAPVPVPHAQAPAAPVPHAQAPAAPVPHAQAPAAPVPHAQAPAAPVPHAQAPAAPVPHAQAPAAQAPRAQEKAAPVPHAQAPAAQKHEAEPQRAQPHNPTAGAPERHPEAARPQAPGPAAQPRNPTAAAPERHPEAARPQAPVPAAQAPAPVAVPNPAAQQRPIPNPNAAAPPPGRPGEVRPLQGQAPQAIPRENPGQPRPQQNGDRRGGGLGTGGALAIGAAAGLAGGFLAATGARGIDDIRRDRREVNEGGVDYIREPGRTIVREGDRSFVVHDENERFRDLGLNLRNERRGDDNVAIYDGPNGEQILTFTDGSGRLVRRVRRFRDGREVVLIDNGIDGRVRDYRDDVVVLPEEPLRIPRNRFIVDADGADETVLYDTLIAPPVAPLAQRYTLDQVRYSPDLRARMRSVDVDTLNFDPGSWVVPPDQARKLQVLGEAVKKAVSKNQNEVFLIEGYTDATGNPTDNLSLSDRRAQSVATIMTRDFGVPPENLTTQGYGQQYLKENTQGSSKINRRVTLRRITPLLAASGNAPR